MRTQGDSNGVRDVSELNRGRAFMRTQGDSNGVRSIRDYMAIGHHESQRFSIPNGDVLYTYSSSSLATFRIEQ